MKKLSEGDNPKEFAKIVSKKYLDKGYNLNFTLKSLEDEIDKILETEIPIDWVASAKLASELTAYLGETLCQIFGTRWKGKFYIENIGMNFYFTKIQINEFEFGPSHFFGYYLKNGKGSEGSFKDYLYSRNKSHGILKDFLGGGLINKIKLGK